MSEFEQIEQLGGNKQAPNSQVNFSCNYKFQAVNWVLTWNNYPDDVFEQLSKLLVPLCDKWIFGKEVGEKGTPHIQGAFKLKKKMRQGAIYNLFGCEFFLDKMKGRWCDQVYCAKGDNFICDKPIRHKPTLITYDMLRQEQKDIADRFKDYEDPLFGRKVYWFFEEKGNWGKSILCKYLVDQEEAFIVQGKNNDILFGISEYVSKHGNSPKIVIVDVPRCNQGHVSYQAIESIKNGCLYSSKYESGMIRFDSPHVLVFSNQIPEVHNLSADRWEIEYLGNDDEIEEELSKVLDELNED